MSTTSIFALAGFVLGLPAGALILWRALPTRLRQNVDYKDRWQRALDLLTQEGKATPEQIARLKGDAPKRRLDRAPSGQESILGRQRQLREIHQMASWDRAECEIQRAKAGLPPVDDLAGMASWHVADVLKARAHAVIKRELGEREL